jgi:hypothetical protein
MQGEQGCSEKETGVQSLANLIGDSGVTAIPTECYHSLHRIVDARSTANGKWYATDMQSSTHQCFSCATADVARIWGRAG